MKILLARKGNQKLSVLIFAIENFRRIELVHGRWYAERALKEVARAVQPDVPTGGFIARYGDMLALVAKTRQRAT